MTIWALSVTQAAGGDAPDTQINQVVDMVVAEVDSRIITLSEVLAETRLVLLRQSGAEHARLAPVGRPLLMAVLRTAVARSLLLSEASRLNLSAIPEAEVQQEVRSIRGRFANRGEYVRFLEQFGFTVGSEALMSAAAPVPPLLIDIVRAELEVERFVALRVHSSIVVSEDDIRSCFLSQINLFGGQPLEDVRGRIEETIRATRADLRLIRLLTQLQSKTKIKFANNFKPKGPLLDVSRDAESVGLECPEIR